jgi:hypothetical protein
MEAIRSGRCRARPLQTMNWWAGREPSGILSSCLDTRYSCQPVNSLSGISKLSKSFAIAETINHAGATVHNTPKIRACFVYFLCRQIVATTAIGSSHPFTFLDTRPMKPPRNRHEHDNNHDHDAHCNVYLFHDHPLGSTSVLNSHCRSSGPCKLPGVIATHLRVTGSQIGVLGILLP